MVEYDLLSLMPMLGAFLGVFVVVFLALYVYAALALMTIAKKTKTVNPWLAWIPIANLYLMTQIGKVPWWTLLIVLLAGFIPIVGMLAVVGIMIWWWWRIRSTANASRRGRSTSSTPRSWARRA